MRVPGRRAGGALSLYAESSAVLAWLFGEPAGEEVRRALGAAERVLTSELTLIECERVLHRARALDELSEATTAERRAHLLDASGAWHRFPMDGEIVERARQSFPVEPVRSLDAIHLATALSAAATVPGLVLLSLDARVRDCGAALGLRVIPKPVPHSGKSPK